MMKPRTFLLAALLLGGCLDKVEVGSIEDNSDSQISADGTNDTGENPDGRIGDADEDGLEDIVDDQGTDGTEDVSDDSQPDDSAEDPSEDVADDSSDVDDTGEADGEGDVVSDTSGDADSTADLADDSAGDLADESDTSDVADDPDVETEPDVETDPDVVTDAADTTPDVEEPSVPTLVRTITGADLPAGAEFGSSIVVWFEPPTSGSVAIGAPGGGEGHVLIYDLSNLGSDPAIRTDAVEGGVDHFGTALALNSTTLYVVDPNDSGEETVLWSVSADGLTSTPTSMGTSHTGTYLPSVAAVPDVMWLGLPDSDVVQIEVATSGELEGPTDSAFGASVAIHHRFAAVGAPLADTDTHDDEGIVYVYEHRRSTSPVALNPLEAWGASNLYYGTSVAIAGGSPGSSSGSFAVVGIPGYGGAELFLYQDGSGQFSSGGYLTPDYTAVALGHSVAAFRGQESDADYRAVVGDPEAAGGRVMVHSTTFDSPMAWDRAQLERPEGIDAGDRFGEALAIDGETLFVGAPGYGDSGAVFVYDWPE